MPTAPSCSSTFGSGDLCRALLVFDDDTEYMPECHECQFDLVSLLHPASYDSEALLEVVFHAEQGRECSVF